MTLQLYQSQLVCRSIFHEVSVGVWSLCDRGGLTRLKPSSLVCREEYGGGGESGSITILGITCCREDLLQALLLNVLFLWWHGTAESGPYSFFFFCLLSTICLLLWELSILCPLSASVMCSAVTNLWPHFNYIIKRMMKSIPNSPAKIRLIWVYMLLCTWFPGNRCRHYDFKGT